MNQNKQIIIFRVDGYPKIGYGHLIRSLTLGIECKKQLMNIRFITYKDAFAEQKLKEQNIHYILTDYKAGTQEDLFFISKELEKLSRPFFYHDNYSIDHKYEKNIRPLVNKIIAMDDEAVRTLDSDIIINQNYGAEEYRYKTNNTAQRQFLGIHYTLLRDEILKHCKKNQRNRVKNILITFGGSDIHNMTVRIVKLVSEYIMKNQIFLHCIVNKNFKGLTTLKKLGSKNKYIILHEDVKDMGTLMEKMDMAISAGGSTLWELLYVGVPTIAIIIAQNQFDLVSRLSKKGYVENLGLSETLEDFILFNRIKQFILDVDKRKFFYERGQKLIDGKGKERICKLMKKIIYTKDIIIRKAKEIDTENIFKLSNEKSVRANSINEEQIEWKEHVKWFNNKINDDNCVYYVVYTENNRFVGQIRYDIESNEAIVNISVSPEFRDMGLGQKILAESIQLFSQEQNNIEKILAYIKPKNNRSIKLFQNVGFIYACDSIKKHINLKQYVYRV